jgi:hypothetical protein
MKPPTHIGLLAIWRFPKPWIQEGLFLPVIRKKSKLGSAGGMRICTPRQRRFHRH